MHGVVMQDLKNISFILLIINHEMLINNNLCVVLYCIVLYCIVLYCIVLYCIVLHCVALCYILVNKFL